MNATAIKPPSPVADADPAAEWLTSEAVARLLSMSTRTLFRLVEQGRFPAPTRLSRKLTRFRRADVYGFIGAVEVAPPPAPAPAAPRPAPIASPANPLPHPSDRISVSTAALLLNVSVWLVYRLIRTKKVRSWRVCGGPHILSKVEVLALVEVSGPEPAAAEPAPRPALSGRWGATA
jgi:excisionase family DNA binding protein